MPASDLSQYAVPAATIVAAGLTAVAGFTAGSWNVRELQLSYEQRVRDTYLENARKVAGDVYVPLAIAISDLSRAYETFRERVDFVNTQAPAGSVNQFKGACNKFLELVAGLMSRGASAYLTISLEEELAQFRLFIDASLSATTTTSKLTLTPSIYGLQIHLLSGVVGPNMQTSHR